MLVCRSSECAIAAEALMKDGGRGKACLCLPERIARSQAGGRQVHQVFGSELNELIEELNGVLAA